MLYLKNKNEISLDSFQRFDVNNWDELKKHISYKLVNKKVLHASEDVDDIVYQDCMDLSKVYIVTEISQDRKKVISYVLKHQDLEHFQKDTDELYTQVRNNYLQDTNKRIRTLKEDVLAHEVLYPLMKSKKDITVSEENMFIEDSSNYKDNILFVTNKYNVFGTSYMFDHSTLNEIYNRMGCNFYIIPTSVHQFMCVSKDYVTKDKDLMEAEDDLLDMLYKMNSENKNTEDILSYRIYLYLHDDGHILFPIKQRL